MTVSYNLDVSSTSLVAFLKLQFRWRGSIWKSILRELALFSFAFAVILGVYRSSYLTEEQRKFWDDLAALFDQKLDYIPLTFMLGFFVTIIVGRWNDIFTNMGWVDNTALLCSVYLRGSDEKSRMARRNVVRYMALTQLLIFRDISMQVRRRFPALETVVAAGFMTEAELVKYNDCPWKYQRFFLPIQWSFNILYDCRQSGKIPCDLMLNEIIKHITDFRKGLAQLANFDWVPIPLVYPQVVFLAVRSYFFLCLVARQSILIDGEPPKVDTMVYPMISFGMTALQFIFYVGWMKVAESLMNPLGEDDDDFECNYLLDRNLSLGLSMVDDTYNDYPDMQKDKFWSAEVIVPLYSADSASKPVNPQVGSAAVYEGVVDGDQQEIVMMPHQSEQFSDEDLMDDAEGAKLLPRVVSVVSVNRGVCGSRTSLVSRRGVFDSIRHKFSGRQDSRNKLSRPNRLAMSQMSLNCDRDLLERKMTFDGVGERDPDCQTEILDELADEVGRNPTLLTPDNFIDRDKSPPSRRLTPVSVEPTGPLPSVPEDDEEAQKTRTSIDLKKWKAEFERELSKKGK